MMAIKFSTANDKSVYKTKHCLQVNAQNAQVLEKTGILQ